MPTPIQRPKVFISYSHDSEEHKQRVLALADSLRHDGIDAQIDQYELSPAEGWPRWMERMIRESKYVLVIGSRGYLERAENVVAGQNDPGRGVRWETLLVYEGLYRTQSRSDKLVPVVFQYEEVNFIPAPLQGLTFHCLSSERGYEMLYRALTNQHLVEPSDIAEEIKILDPLPHLPIPNRWGGTMFTQPPQVSIRHARAAGGDLEEDQSDDDRAEINRLGSKKAREVSADAVAQVRASNADGMRSFLQRAEVRLSTMHRIAGVFLNGAGLLLLFPILFRETLRDMVVRVIAAPGKSGNTVGRIVEIFHSRSPRGALLIASALMFALPLAALYLLVRDLIRFYFTAHNPYRDLEELADEQFYPRLGLAGLSFPSDEAEGGDKRAIWKLQELPHLRWFLLPRRGRDKRYYDELPEMLIPPSRKQWVAEASGVAHDRRRLALAFGLAAVSDRPLIEEVARAEVSLVRHSLLLRRLVLRYVKALMVFIVLLVFSFLVTIFVEGQSAGGQSVSMPARDYPYIFIGFSYIIWSIVTALCV